MWENRAGLPVIQENVLLGDSCLPGNAFVYAVPVLFPGDLPFFMKPPGGAVRPFRVVSQFCYFKCVLFHICHLFSLDQIPLFYHTVHDHACPEDMLYSIFLLWKCPALSSSFFKLIFLCYWFTSKSCAGCDRIRTSKINVWRRNHQWKKDFLQPY